MSLLNRAGLILAIPLLLLSRLGVVSEVSIHIEQSTDSGCVEASTKKSTSGFFLVHAGRGSDCHNARQLLHRVDLNFWFFGHGRLPSWLVEQARRRTRECYRRRRPRHPLEGPCPSGNRLFLRPYRTSSVQVSS